MRMEYGNVQACFVRTIGYDNLRVNIQIFISNDELAKNDYPEAEVTI